MAFEKKDSRVLFEGGGFIAPAECGSTIMFSTVDSGYEGDSIETTIQLTDCSRMISWNFPCSTAGIAKIDKAIKILQDAREASFKGSAELVVKLKKEAVEERRKARENKK